MLDTEKILNVHTFILTLLFIMFSPLILVLIFLLFGVFIVSLLIQVFFYIVPIGVITNYIGIVVVDIMMLISTGSEIGLHEKVIIFSPHFMITNIFIFGLFCSLLYIFKLFKTSTKETKTNTYTLLFWISLGITSWICW